MSTSEVTIAGFGGQGILLIGQLLAYTANRIGKSVSWLPAYGPEMRGGTANCMVVIADAEVNSPLIINPTAVIAMNKPSLLRFAPMLRPGGLLVINKDMVDQPSACGDVTVVAIGADSIAEKLGDSRVANMVALGAFIGASRIVSLAQAIECLPEVLPKYRADLLALNVKALQAGYDYVTETGWGCRYDYC